MSIDQMVIALAAALAAWINQDPRAHVRRWAGVLGMVGQPFYLYATWHAAQWGMFLVSIVFTASYLRGIRLGWRARG